MYIYIYIYIHTYINHKTIKPYTTKKVIDKYSSHSTYKKI